MTEAFDKELQGAVEGVMAGFQACWHCPAVANTRKGLNLPGQQAVHEVLNQLIAVLFPGCHTKEAGRDEDLQKRGAKRLKGTMLRLADQVRSVLEYQCKVDACEDCGDCKAQARKAVLAVVRALPGVQKVLQEDIVAAYEGDPAARSTMEVVMSYPGVYAIIVHRIANVLYREKIPMIPRVMSEYAHSITGIDIHPGATIGPGFFIDHGTGVVIGETCTIGRNVKLYQGVTLGAMSFEKDENGNPVKGIKRHPDVGDGVVIYAGATILGGKTRIGAHSEIGGNVWLTHSVPPESRVYNQQPRPLVREADGTWKVRNRPWDDVGGGI